MGVDYTSYLGPVVICESRIVDRWRICEEIKEKLFCFQLCSDYIQSNVDIWGLNVRHPEIFCVRIDNKYETHNIKISPMLIEKSIAEFQKIMSPELDILKKYCQQYTIDFRLISYQS